MNTAIICFSGGNEYLKQKQIANVLREEREQYGIRCKNYDELDRLIPVLREMKVKKLVLLHEDHNIDRFERAAHAEYNHLFEVEIGIDFSKEERRLYEAGGGGTVTTGEGVQQGQQGGTAQRGDQKEQATTLWIFPINPLVMGAVSQIGGVNLPTDESIVVANISSIKCESDGFWGMSAIENSSLIKGGKIGGKKYAFARSWGGIQRLFPSVTTIQGPPNLLKSIGCPNGTVMNPQTRQNVTYKHVPPEVNFDPGQNALNAFNIGAKIVADQKSTKVDDSKVQQWTQDPYAHKTGFLIKCLADIQWAVQNKGKDEATADGKSFVDQALQQFGFYEDIATMSKNLQNGGMALLVDAAKLIADKVGEKKDKKDSKTAPLISHKEWENFANCFDKETDYVEASE